jgi:hypothetical protein
VDLASPLDAEAPALMAEGRAAELADMLTLVLEEWGGEGRVRAVGATVVVDLGDRWPRLAAALAARAVAVAPAGVLHPRLEHSHSDLERVADLIRAALAEIG